MARERNIDDFRAIQVICLSSSHPGKRVRIANLLRDAEGQWTSGAPSMVTFDGVVVTDSPGWPIANAMEQAGIHRRRFDMKCPLCRVGFVARGENLDPVLDEAFDKYPVDTAIIPVPLGWLAAKMASK